MAEDPATFKVWIIFLAYADADGIARIAAPFISSIGRMTIETVREAIKILEGPDENSRSTNDQGRRIRRVDGGWLIINYARYRARSPQEYEAARKRQYRQANPSIAAAENYRRRHPPSSDSESEEEAEGEGDLEPSRTCPGRTQDVPDGQTPPTPSQQAGDGLLEIPKNLPFDASDPLIKGRADIRRLARKITEGRSQDPRDQATLEHWKRQFNQAIEDLK